MDNDPSLTSLSNTEDDTGAFRDDTGSAVATQHDSGLEEKSVYLDLLTELSGVDLTKKVSIILEGVPDGGTLSTGKNNGNKTWSIRQDELSDVSLILPVDSVPPSGTPSKMMKSAGVPIELNQAV